MLLIGRDVFCKIALVGAKLSTLRHCANSLMGPSKIPALLENLKHGVGSLHLLDSHLILLYLLCLQIQWTLEAFCTNSGDLEEQGRGLSFALETVHYPKGILKLCCSSKNQGSLENSPHPCAKDGLGHEVRRP